MLESRPYLNVAHYVDQPISVGIQYDDKTPAQLIEINDRLKIIYS